MTFGIEAVPPMTGTDQRDIKCVIHMGQVIQHMPSFFCQVRSPTRDAPEPFSLTSPHVLLARVHGKNTPPPIRMWKSR